MNTYSQSRLPHRVGASNTLSILRVPPRSNSDQLGPRMAYLYDLSAQSPDSPRLSLPSTSHAWTHPKVQESTFLSLDLLLRAAE